MIKEACDFDRLLAMLENVYFSHGRGDIRIWKPDIRGMFSMKSFVKNLTVNSDRMEVW